MKNYFRNLITVTGDVETPLHAEIVLVLVTITGKTRLLKTNYTMTSINSRRNEKLFLNCS